MSSAVEQPKTLGMLEPDERLRFFGDSYTPFTDIETAKQISQRATELELDFTDDELIIIASLDHPDKVQNFLDRFIQYNYDHPVIGHEHDNVETTFSPRQVLAQGKAHCFEGALFAYMVNYLHGYDPKLVLFEAKMDLDHNIVVWQDRHSGLWGSNGKSGYPGLSGRPSVYKDIQSLVVSYKPYYYSGYSNDPNDLSLVGYSEPLDLVKKFGTKWLGSMEEQWDMFENFVAEEDRFYYLNGNLEKPHMYPGFKAVKNLWVQKDPNSGEGYVCVECLPYLAQIIWHQFKEVYTGEPYPHENAGRLVEEFFILTGITPLDLISIAQEV